MEKELGCVLDRYMVAMLDKNFTRYGGRTWLHY